MVAQPTAPDLVVELLRTLDEARTSWNAGSNGGGVILMPTLYGQGSYAELERRMIEMREDRRWRRHWWNLITRYRHGWEQRMVVSSLKTKQGRIPVLPARTELRATYCHLDATHSLVRVYQWEEVDDWLVEAGVLRLTEVMYDGKRERIHLPIELLHRLMGKSVAESDNREAAVF